LRVHFQRLRILQERVIGLADRGDPARPAVHELAFQHTLFQQNQGWIEQQPQLQTPGRTACRQDLGQTAGIAIDALHLAVDVGLALMHEHGVEPLHAPDATIRRRMHRIMRIHAMHAAVEQAQMMVVLAPRMLPAPEHALATRQLESGRRRFMQRRLDHLGGAGRQCLIGIEQHDPVMRRLIDRTLLLRPISLERLDQHPRTVPSRDLDRTIATAGIEHEQFIGKRQRRETGLERGGVVEGGDHGRQRQSVHGRASRGGAACAIQTSSSQK